MIDLRSDTVTLPTAEMKDFMMRAPLGDDVYGEDPSVNALQDFAADLLGKEAALFVPSGTMANQLAVGVNTVPGDELICDPTYHIYHYEAGGIARLWGVTPRTVEGKEGILTLESLLKCESIIRPDDAHFAQTKLLCLENTTNRAGGKVYPLAEIISLKAWVQLNQLRMHLDGARLFNAVVASGVSAKTWAESFDTVSICLSKGLGAPAGSLLLGKRQDMAKAKRLRKLLGGGMRQAGFLAAAGLYALKNHVQYLQEDHEKAQLLAKAVNETEGLELEQGPVQTNIVWIKIDPQYGSSGTLAAKLKQRGILLNAIGSNLLRACTHLSVSRGQVEEVAAMLRGFKKI